MMGKVYFLRTQESSFLVFDLEVKTMQITALILLLKSMYTKRRKLCSHLFIGINSAGSEDS